MKSLLETILSRKLHDPKVVIYNWLDEYDIKNYTVNDKAEIDVDGDVNLMRKGLKEFPSFIQFGVVKGFFDCSYNNLTSLKGSPKEVDGDFDCGSNKLITLEGAPKEVSGSFDCCSNKLTSLEGSPREVKGFFDCSYNQLTSLKGSPKKVGGFFACGHNSLRDLKGSPNKVEGCFNCIKNTTKFTEDDVKNVCIVKDIIV